MSSPAMMTRMPPKRNNKKEWTDDY